MPPRRRAGGRPSRSARGDGATPASSSALPTPAPALSLSATTPHVDPGLEFHLHSHGQSYGHYPPGGALDGGPDGDGLTARTMSDPYQFATSSAPASPPPALHSPGQHHHQTASYGSGLHDPAAAAMNAGFAFAPGPSHDLTPDSNPSSIGPRSRRTNDRTSSTTTPNSAHPSPSPFHFNPFAPPDPKSQGGASFVSEGEAVAAAANPYYSLPVGGADVLGTGLGTGIAGALDISLGGAMNPMLAMEYPDLPTSGIADGGIPYGYGVAGMTSTLVPEPLESLMGPGTAPMDFSPATGDGFGHGVLDGTPAGTRKGKDKSVRRGRQQRQPPPRLGKRAANYDDDDDNDDDGIIEDYTSELEPDSDGWEYEQGGNLTDSDGPMYDLHGDDDDDEDGDDDDENNGFNIDLDLDGDDYGDGSQSEEGESEGDDYDDDDDDDDYDEDGDDDESRFLVRLMRAFSPNAQPFESETTESQNRMKRLQQGDSAVVHDHILPPARQRIRRHSPDPGTRLGGAASSQSKAQRRRRHRNQSGPDGADGSVARRRQKVADPGIAFKQLQTAATTALLDGRFEVALAHARSAVKQNPEIYPAHSLLSEILQAMGREAESVAVLLSGAHSSRDPMVWWHVAERVGMLGTRDPASGQSESELDRIRRLNGLLYCFTNLCRILPDEPEPRMEKVRVLDQLGRLGRPIIRDCEILLKLQPLNVEALRIMTSASLKMGAGRRLVDGRFLNGLVDRWDVVLDRLMAPYCPDPAYGPDGQILNPGGKKKIKKVRLRRRRRRGRSRSRRRTRDYDDDDDDDDDDDEGGSGETEDEGDSDDNDDGDTALDDDDGIVPDEGELSFDTLDTVLDLFIVLGRYADGLRRARAVARWLTGREAETFWDTGPYPDDDREWDVEDEPGRRAEVWEYVGQAGGDSGGGDGHPRAPAELYGRALPAGVRVKFGVLRLKLEGRRGGVGGNGSGKRWTGGTRPEEMSGTGEDAEMKDAATAGTPADDPDGDDHEKYADEDAERNRLEGLRHLNTLFAHAGQVPPGDYEDLLRLASEALIEQACFEDAIPFLEALHAHAAGSIVGSGGTDPASAGAEPHDRDRPQSKKPKSRWDLQSRAEKSDFWLALATCYKAVGRIHDAEACYIRNVDLGRNDRSRNRGEGEGESDDDDYDDDSEPDGEDDDDDSDGTTAATMNMGARIQLFNFYQQYGMTDKADRLIDEMRASRQEEASAPGAQYGSGTGVGRNERLRRGLHGQRDAANDGDGIGDRGGDAIDPRLGGSGSAERRQRRRRAGKDEASDGTFTGSVRPSRRRYNRWNLEDRRRLRRSARQLGFSTGAVDRSAAARRGPRGTRPRPRQGLQDGEGGFETFRGFRAHRRRRRGFGLGFGFGHGLEAGLGLGMGIGGRVGLGFGLGPDVEAPIAPRALVDQMWASLEHQENRLDELLAVGREKGFVEEYEDGFDDDESDESDDDDTTGLDSLSRARAESRQRRRDQRGWRARIRDTRRRWLETAHGLLDEFRSCWHFWPTRDKCVRFGGYSLRYLEAQAKVPPVARFGNAMFGTGGLAATAAAAVAAAAAAAATAAKTEAGAMTSGGVASQLSSSSDNGTAAFSPAPGLGDPIAAAAASNTHRTRAAAKQALIDAMAQAESKTNMAVAPKLHADFHGVAFTRWADLFCRFAVELSRGGICARRGRGSAGTVPSAGTGAGAPALTVPSSSLGPTPPNNLLRLANSGDKHGKYAAAKALLATAQMVNVFYHSATTMRRIRLTSLALALIADDPVTACGDCRWLIKTYPLSRDVYKLMSVVHRVMSAGGFGIGDTMYSVGPTQKFVLRLVKMMDFRLLKPEDRVRVGSKFTPSERARWGNSLANEGLLGGVGDSSDDEGEGGGGGPDEVAAVFPPAAGLSDATATTASNPFLTTHNPFLLTLYGHMLASGRQIGALNYYFRALALRPDDPVLNLSVAAVYLQNAVKRRADNRHLEILLARAFLGRYVRFRLGACQLETTGAEGGGPAAAADSSSPSPSLIVRQEVVFNAGRFWHTLGLLHLATDGYERCLRLEEDRERAAKGGDNQEGERDSEGGRQGDRQGLSSPHPSFAPEAAYALRIIYAQIGNGRAARRIMERWMVM